MRKKSSRKKQGKYYYLRDILHELNLENEEWLITLGDEMIAQGERDADEVYCGYFD